MTNFSAIGAAGVVMDVKTGEVLAMTSLPEVNPNAPGHGHSRRAVQSRDAQGVYELGSTFKPFTVAMAMDSGTIKSFGQHYNCPQVLAVYGHLVHDTHPFGRICTVAEIMEESSNIGTAQIADQLGTARQKVWLGKMGFTGPVPIELKERGRALTPGARWGPFETMTVGFGQGIAVAPLQLAMGYATLVQWRRLSPADPNEDRHRASAAAGQARVQRGNQLPDAGAAPPGGHEGHRQKGRRARLSRWRQDRHRAKADQRPLQPDHQHHELRRCVPDGRAALCDRRRCSTNPRRRKDTYGFTTAGWNVAPVVSGTIGRIAPMLGVAAGHEPRARHVARSCPSSTKPRNNNSGAATRPGGRGLRFESDGICDRPSQGGARQRVRRLQGRSVQRRGLHRPGGRARRGCGRRSARSDGRGGAATRRPPSRADCSPSSPRNSTRLSPRPSSRSPAPTARPRLSR